MLYIYYRQRKKTGMNVDEYSSALSNLNRIISKYTIEANFISEEGDLGIFVKDNVSDKDIEEIKAMPIVVKVVNIDGMMNMKMNVSVAPDLVMLTKSVNKNFAMYIKKALGLFNILVVYRKIPDIENNRFLYEIYCDPETAKDIDIDKLANFIRENQEMIEMNETRREETGCYVNFSSVEIPLREIGIQVFPNKNQTKEKVKEYNKKYNVNLFIMREGINGNYVCVLERYYDLETIDIIMKEDKIGYATKTLMFIHRLKQEFKISDDRFVKIRYKGYKAKQVIQEFIKGAEDSVPTEEYNNIQEITNEENS